MKKQIKVALNEMGEFWSYIGVYGYAIDITEELNRWLKSYNDLSNFDGGIIKRVSLRVAGGNVDLHFHRIYTEDNFRYGMKQPPKDLWVEYTEQR